MFGDLNWPPNASRRFVSISWASCSHWFVTSVELWFHYVNMSRLPELSIYWCLFLHFQRSDRWAQLIVVWQNYRFLDLLNVLCVCNGVAIPNNQTYITEHWLRRDSVRVRLVLSGWVSLFTLLLHIFAASLHIFLHSYASTTVLCTILSLIPLPRRLCFHRRLLVN